MTMRSVKDDSECTHMIKGVSTAGIRKKLKSDSLKSFCHPCTFRAFENTNEHWLCLQCGNIGCGDQDAQNGDASKHYHTPRSDLHCIVVHLEKDSKCWCFECKAEVNSKSAHLKDAITLVKRSVKFRNAVKPGQQQKVESPDAGAKSGPNAVSSSIAIPLPPPVPASVPSIEVTESNNKKGHFSGRYQHSRGSVSDDSVIPRPKDKPFGLQNLGNTCFMNSALQCLASTRALLPKLEIFGNGQELRMIVTQTEDEAILTVLGSNADGAAAGLESIHEGDGDIANNNIGYKGKDGKRFEITLEISPESMTGRLQHTIKAIRKDENFDAIPGVIRESYSSKEFFGWGESQGFRPRGVHDLIGKNFRPGQQHDAHELLRTIVDMMKKDQTKAFRKAIMKHYGVEVGGEGSDPELVELVKTLDQKVKHKTFVDDVFGGELMTIQTCLTCKSVKKSHEQFLDLSLPIRVVKHSEDTGEKKPAKKFSLFYDSDTNIVMNRTMEECLRAFTEPELLTGSNVVECENCHKLNLAKIEAGVPVEEVFPSVFNEKTKVEPKTSPQSDKSGKRVDDRKKKRPTRQQKLRNQAERNSAAVPVSTEASETEAVQATEPTETEANLDLVENHFELPDGKTVNPTCTTTEDPERKCGGDSSSNQSGSLEDYVVIQTDVTKAGPSGSTKRKLVEMETPDSEQQPLLGLQPGKLSESLQNLTLLQLEESEDMNVDVNVSDIDDLDLPPAMDGIGGSASEEEDNDMPHLNLDLPCHDKFKNFQITETDEVPCETETENCENEKPATADEGFSEGENSGSIEHEGGQHRRSQSSSRNSISDPDDVTKSCPPEETEKDISPKVSESEEDSPVVVEAPKIPKVTRCPCSRQQTISRPPEFLTIHFKRFQMSYGGSATKVSHHVSFPLTLDLTPFCYPGDGDGDGDSSIFDDDGQVLYSLYGLVEHGGSLNWGHYTAHVKTEGDKWFYISDSSVSQTSVKSVKEVEAYILFYERVRSIEEKRRLSLTIEPEVKPVEENIWAGWDDEPGQRSTTPTVSATVTNWSELPAPEEDWDNLAAPAPGIPAEWMTATATTVTVSDSDKIESESVVEGWAKAPEFSVQQWDEEESVVPTEVEACASVTSSTTSFVEVEPAMPEDLLPNAELSTLCTVEELEHALGVNHSLPIKEDDLMDVL